MMTKCHFKFSAVSSFKNRKSSDALILPFWRGKARAEHAFAKPGDLKDLFSRTSIMEDFKGKKGEVFFLYSEKSKEKRVVLLGLGEKSKIDLYSLREAFHSLVLALKPRKIRKVNIAFPDIAKMAKENILRAICESLILSSYDFKDLQHDTLEKSHIQLESAEFIAIQEQELKICDEVLSVCKGVYLTRDLINRNADDITPQKLAEVAKSLEKLSPKIKTTIFDKKRIEKEKMGLLLAVNRGSPLEPRFIIVSYRGKPSSKDHFALVGKGITYDTGGLSLKPTNFMLDMKSDMGGSATVLGVMYALSMLKAKVNVSAIIPSSENSIGSKSYKIGDVYQGYSGKTVEITNTDAEGRLALADALSYVVKRLKPKGIIDLATLTGGIVVALGDEIAGYFSNNEALAKKVENSAKQTDELIWRMPLHQSYMEILKSKVADMKNSGGREASGIQGALFLQPFVEKTPWVHIDIAGTAFWEKSKRYSPIFATGYGVRMLVHMMQHLD